MAMPSRRIRWNIRGRRLLAEAVNDALVVVIVIANDVQDYRLRAAVNFSKMSALAL